MSKRSLFLALGIGAALPLGCKHADPNRTASSALADQPLLVTAYRLRAVAATLDPKADHVRVELTSPTPFAARTLDPALYIGKTEVRDYEMANADRTIIFDHAGVGDLAPTPKLTFGWAEPAAGAPLEEAVDVPFEFDPNTLPVRAAIQKTKVAILR